LEKKLKLPMMKNILVIDDDTYISTLLCNHLSGEGYAADTAHTAKKGLEKIVRKNFDLVLLDYRLPDGEGIENLLNIRKIVPDIPVIIITAYAEVYAAVKLIKAGAFDYVVKPIRPEELLSLIKRALKQRTEGDARQDFRDRLITGNSPEMQDILKMVKIVAPTFMTVLIEGQTGTGKEFISRAIHYNSKRKNQAFVAVDCGAIPDEIANSELFGHVKGSFTGAIRDKKGSFEAAHGGTLFLDEIGNLSYEVQIKLLRVLQERKISRVGENKDICVDVRIIAASNIPLVNLVRENKFREDLFHRINEFKITVPPLNERPEDIMVFANHFMEEANEELDRDVKGFSEEVKNLLMGYAWIGNLRELRNVVKRAVLLCRDEIIRTTHLPDEITKNDGKELAAGTPVSLKDAVRQAEKKAVLNALKRAGNNKTRAAQLLHIDRKTLYNKLSDLDIDLSAK
jgi:two-component system response regulator HydG